jgi:hypothetical protein
MTAVNTAFRARGSAVRAVKVQAHSGEEFNDRADALARAAAAADLPPSIQLTHFSDVHNSLLRLVCADDLNRNAAVAAPAPYAPQCLVAVHLSSRDIFRMHSLLHQLSTRAALKVQGLCCPAPPLQLSHWIAAGGQLSQPVRFPRLHCASALTGEEWRKHGLFALRFVHRILPTRAHRLNMQQVDNAACLLCGQDETFSHVFGDSGCTFYAPFRHRALATLSEHLLRAGLPVLAAHHIAALLLTSAPDNTPALLFDTTSLLNSLSPACQPAASAFFASLNDNTRATFWSNLSRLLLSTLHYWWSCVYDRD